MKDVKSLNSRDVIGILAKVKYSHKPLVLIFLTNKEIKRYGISRETLGICTRDSSTKYWE